MVETRWNSVIPMLESVIDNREEIQVALLACGKQEKCLSEQVFAVIIPLLDVLKPFEEATERLSKEKIANKRLVANYFSFIEKTFYSNL
jgi:hypothetical protein